MKVRYSRIALAQLDELYNYIASDNPDAAQDVITSIQTSIDNLALFPHAGRRTDIENVRRLVVGKYGHVAFYTFTDATVIILRILHGRQIKE